MAKTDKKARERHHAEYVEANTGDTAGAAASNAAEDIAGLTALNRSAVPARSKTDAQPGADGVKESDGGDEAGDDGPAKRIAGLSALKGLIMYGAVLTFAAFYAYFMTRVAAADSGVPPTFNAAMLSSAAALAGVLGSAFALVVGIPTRSTNKDLGEAMTDEDLRDRVSTKVRRLLSLEPSNEKSASWPLTFGIWVYAVVGAAVAIIYFLNQGETPAEIKALAVVFAGYVIALVTAAYGIATR